MAADGGSEIKCNVACWFDRRGGDEFISIEISPRYPDGPNPITTSVAIQRFLRDSDIAAELEAAKRESANT